MSSCSISGVPRTTHTMTLTIADSGLKRDIEPKDIISPKGIAPMSVTKNNLSVCKKPWFSDAKTIGNCSAIPLKDIVYHPV